MTGVKICGLSTLETMHAALNAGAEYVGLVFYGPSPRNISFEQGKKLAETARGKAKIVALTVDADDRLIDSIVNIIAPDYIQAHGSETPQRVAEITARSAVKVIKVIKLRLPNDLDIVADYTNCADFLLFDAKPPEDMENTLPGGNGISFDWQMLADYGKTHHFMLSGGLEAANVTQAIKITSAAMVDVSSGVETSPGKKDVGLIEKFIKTAHGNI